jgi:hypothetical protein
MLTLFDNVISRWLSRNAHAGVQLRTLPCKGEIFNQILCIELGLSNGPGMTGIFFAKSMIFRNSWEMT